MSFALRALIVVATTAVAVVGTIALQRHYIPDSVDPNAAFIKADELLNLMPPDGALDDSAGTRQVQLRDSGSQNLNTSASKGGLPLSRLDATWSTGQSAVKETGLMTATHIVVSSDITANETPPEKGGDFPKREISSAEVSETLSSNQPRAIDFTPSARLIPVPANDSAAALPPGARQAAGSSPALTSDALQPLAKLEPLELMRRLRDSDAGQQRLAHDELSRRGFNQVEFELAAQLLDPNMEVRKRLANTVPRLTTIDAVPWLFWLSQDPEPSVRYVALSTLGTTGDPDILQRVEGLARRDHDQMVRELADKIARQQKAIMQR